MNRMIYLLFLVIFFTTNSCSPGRSTDDPNKSNDGLIMGLVGIPSQDANTVVTGTLNDASGNPLTFATLTLGGTSSSVQAKEAVSTSTKTDASGNFTLYLKVGTFSIRVTNADGIDLGSFQMKVSAPATTPVISGMPSSLGITGLLGGKPGTTPTSPTSPTLPLTPPSSITFNNGIIPTGWNSNGANWTITSSGCAAGYGTCLRSGSIGDSSSTSISVAKSTVSGTVSFIWNVSSESGYDYCKFYIDGNLQSGQISGSPGWSPIQFSISSGSHTFRWEYSKDGSSSSGSDACYIDNVLFPSTPAPSSLTYNGGSSITLGLGYNVIINPTVYEEVTSYTVNPSLPSGLTFNTSTGSINGTPTTLQSPSNYSITASNSVGSISHTLSISVVVITKITFNDGLVPVGWNSSGSANWTITSSGCEVGYGSCLRSGIIGNSSSTSISVSKSTASGTVSFRWNVSSESGYDYCKFYIDGNLQTGQISGSPGWSPRQFTISSGSHTFRWEYSKDGSASSGSDACYIDEVSLP